MAAVSNFIAEYSGSIMEANHYADPVSSRLYMRVVIAQEPLPFGLDGLRELFSPIAKRYAMDWKITDSSKGAKVVLMVSKEAHCLRDLLYRWHSGDMDFDIVGVISNHDIMRDYVEWHEIPYHHVPVDTGDKEPHFKEVSRIIDEAEADVVVLARYMQIIPSWFCEKYPGNIINIHHSFLPSFIGAKPYHQAYDRGVKLTGATCHYVTQDLDEGPIIEQDIARISHHDSIDKIVCLGKDVEKSVLAKGLRYHLEDRVLRHGHKTVVFA